MVWRPLLGCQQHPWELEGVKAEGKRGGCAGHTEHESVRSQLRLCAGELLPPETLISSHRGQQGRCEIVDAQALRGCWEL